MASCGDSQNGGRYPARFDSGSTSGFMRNPQGLRHEGTPRAHPLPRSRIPRSQLGTQRGIGQRHPVLDVRGVVHRARRRDDVQLQLPARRGPGGLGRAVRPRRRRPADDRRLPLASPASRARPATTTPRSRPPCPVTISPHDDRAECPEGVQPAVIEPGHPVLDGVPQDWPPLLGYNRLAAKSATQVLVRCDADPLLVVGSHGAGRSAAFASDCAPHWCPPDFMAWPGYNPLWGNLLTLAVRPAVTRTHPPRRTPQPPDPNRMNPGISPRSRRANAQVHCG